MPNPTIDASAPNPPAEVHPAEAQPGGTIDWRTSIPAELRTEKSLENVKDLPTLVKNYVEAQKYIGGAIRIPGENAKPEEWKAFNAKLGVPEKVEDYKITRPILPEHVGWNDDLHGKILNVAHTAGLNTKQAKKLVEGLSEVVSSTTKDPQKVLEENKTELTKRWGDNFGRNLILATRGAEHLGGEKLLKALERTGAGMDPDVLEALSSFGSGLLEQGLIKNEDTRLETVADAEAKIAAIKGDAKHAYWDGAHPNHDAAVQEYRRLLQVIEANK